MGCECWNRNIQEEHKSLDSQAEALKATLEHPCGARDRRVALWQILLSFRPRLESHLWKEERVLFPALQELLGEKAGTLMLLQSQHEQLRDHLKRLAILAESGASSPWEAIVQTGRSLVDLLEEHEKRENDFLLEVLEHSLQPQALMALARQFREAARDLSGVGP